MCVYVHPVMVWIWIIIVSALAGPGGARIKHGPEIYDFHYRWRDGEGVERTLDFSLPTVSVKRDLSFITGFPWRQSSQFVVDAVREYAASAVPEGVELTVSRGGGGVEIHASGMPRRAVERALEQATMVQQEAQDRFLYEHDFFRFADEQFSYDHSKLVLRYSDQVDPVAKALRAQVADRDAFLELALSWVQQIPYEKRKATGADAGYRRPLAMLARNRGDCDSKSVLYMAVVNAAYPRLGMSMVYLPGHALVGLDIRHEGANLAASGVRYTLTEPVGPALAPVGEVGPRARRMLNRGRVTMVRPVAR